MTEYERSAIIGFHLQGAPIEQISWIIGFTYDEVEKVIKEYLKKSS